METKKSFDFYAVWYIQCDVTSPHHISTVLNGTVIYIHTYTHNTPSQVHKQLEKISS